MPPKPQQRRSERKDVGFDIERSSYYRLLNDERQAIEQHQREIAEESGREPDFASALMSWARWRRWEWLDQRAREQSSS